MLIIYEKNYEFIRNISHGIPYMYLIYIAISHISLIYVQDNPANLQGDPVIL